MIRMPDWRSVSPKKWNTRPVQTSRTTVATKRAISPEPASHSRGIPSSSPIYLITRIWGWVASSVCVKT